MGRSGRGGRTLLQALWATSGGPHLSTFSPAAGPLHGLVPCQEHALLPVCPQPPQSALRVTWGPPLEVQGLGLCFPNAGGPGFDPWSEN